MKNIVFILLIAVTFSSCKSSKKITATDKSTIDRVVDKTTIVRPGDTVVINIPNIRYKDTLIRKINYETKTVASVYYDKEGNQRFECQSAEYYEIRELLKESIKNDLMYNKEKETEFNPQYFIYALAVFGFIICILFYLVIRIQNKMPQMISNSVKNIISNSKQ
jgi:hypothetical protein